MKMLSTWPRQAWLAVVPGLLLGAGAAAAAAAAAPLPGSVALAASPARAPLPLPTPLPLPLPALASAPALAAVPACSGAAAAPERLALQVGKSLLMALPLPLLQRNVGNPAVLQTRLLAPQSLYMLGIELGSTNMLLQDKNGHCRVIDVEVGMDGSALQAALATLMPDQPAIRVSVAADALVLSGTVSDAAALQRALALAAAYVRRPAPTLAGAGTGPDAAPAPSLAPAPAPAPAPAAAAGAAGPGGGRLVNLLDVSAPQQVLLEVKIAEVSKSLLDQLEGNATLAGATGSWVARLGANFLTGSLLGGLVATKSNGSSLALAAQNTRGLVRILAEPSVMAISGQEGSFLAGGKIFIPVAQDNNKVTLEEKEYGVGLRFTPTVLAGGRINLRVAPEVSELSREGIGISATGFTGSAILPLITTRRAQTTVQLYDGQSYAIGGLIKNNQVTNIKALPLLGELPVLGALFRSSDFQQDLTELLFVVTVHLVQPLPPHYALPTDQLTAPGRAALFLGGRMEGPPPPALPAPASPAARCGITGASPC